MEYTRTDSRRLDAAESIFFNRQLEYIKRQLRNVKYKMLRFTQFIPVTTETPSGMESITWRQDSAIGFAKFITNYAKDFPRVNILSEEFTRKIYDIGLSYGWNMKEIRRAKLLNANLKARDALATRRGINQKHNEICWTGDTDRNIPGFIDYPGITEYTVPNGVGGQPTFASKTPDEILTDLNGMVTAIVSTTNGVENPNQILLPIAQYNHLKNTRMTGGDSNTILSFFLSTNPGISVDWLIELSGAGAGSTDRMMCYARDPQNVEYEAPVLYEELPPEQRGMEFTVLARAESAGVVVYYPLSVCFGDGI